MMENVTEKPRTKSGPAKRPKTNGSGNYASDRGKQKYALQQNVKNCNAKMIKTPPRGRGAASLSASAAAEAPRGVPRTPLWNPTRGRPRREAASKAMKAMSPALSMSSGSEGGRWWHTCRHVEWRYIYFLA